MQRYEVNYDWARDTTWDPDHVITLEGRLAGAAAVAAVLAWWERLRPGRADARPCRVYGGSAIELVEQAEDAMSILIVSGGEDAFDSVADAAGIIGDLAVGADDPATTLTWTERPIDAHAHHRGDGAPA